MKKGIVLTILMIIAILPAALAQAQGHTASAVVNQNYTNSPTNTIGQAVYTININSIKEDVPCKVNKATLEFDSAPFIKVYGAVTDRGWDASAPKQQDNTIAPDGTGTWEFTTADKNLMLNNGESLKIIVNFEIKTDAWNNPSFWKEDQPWRQKWTTEQEENCIMKMIKDTDSNSITGAAIEEGSDNESTSNLAPLLAVFVVAGISTGLIFISGKRD